MQGNANRIVLAIFCALVVVVLILVVGANAGRGGGGAGTLPSKADNEVATSDSSTAGDALGHSATLEELKEELATSTAPVGSNARDAAASTNAPNVSQVYAAASTRGFGDVVVFASFDINGGHHDAAALDKDSSDTYSSYSFAHVSQQGVSWMIYVNDGVYVAVPFGTTSETLNKEIILSETDHVTQYDGIKNEYSDFSLDSLGPDVVGVRVDAIDAPTLDEYTLEQLKAL